MTTIHIDAELPDEERRRLLYLGELFVYSATESSKRFSEFARALICEAFDDPDPRTAQHRMSVDDYVATLSELKPRFIHHPRSKEFVRGILRDLGFDRERTFFDVPRMRTSTSDGYLTTGIAYAWHPHRDTWYSAPAAQVNFWLPIWPIRSDNTMAFHPRYFAKIVPNDSEQYNYYEWNSKHRAAAAQQKKTDTRPIPRPAERIETDSDLRVVCPVGGLIVFSGAHLHSSVPNTSGLTRFSIDFRIVNSSDIRAGKGAAIEDAKCTGSSIRDFMNSEDFSVIDQDVVDLLSDGTEASGDLVYSHDARPE